MIGENLDDIRGVPIIETSFKDYVLQDVKPVQIRVQVYRGESVVTTFNVTAEQTAHNTAWDTNGEVLRGRWYIENGRLKASITQSGTHIVNEVGKFAIINLIDENGKIYTKYKLSN